MEKNSLVYSVVMNVLMTGGFLMAAFLMLFGISEYKKILQEAGSTTTRLSATFLLSIFVVYLVTFFCFAIIECRNAWDSAFTPHQIVPADVRRLGNPPADQEHPLQANELHVP